MTGEVNILRLMIFPLMRNLLASLNWCEEYLVNSLSPKKNNTILGIGCDGKNRLMQFANISQQLLLLNVMFNYICHFFYPCIDFFF